MICTKTTLIKASEETNEQTKKTYKLVYKYFNILSPQSSYLWHLPAPLLKYKITCVERALGTRLIIQTRASGRAICKLFKSLVKSKNLS